MTTVKLASNRSQGSLIFTRSSDDTTVSYGPRYPEERELSAAEQVYRERFREAVLYGKIAVGDTGMPAFELAVADFFNAPAIDTLDLSAYAGRAGDLILVRIAEGFEVAGVTVSAIDGEGEILELGDAALAENGWAYHAEADVAPGTTVRLTVTALIRPETEQPE